MNYWLLTTEYPPLQAGGGIGTYCYNTARMMRDNGHNVTVFIYDLSLSNDLISCEDGIKLVRFVPRKTGTHKFLGFNAYISYEYAAIVKAFIEKEGQPDLIESQEYHGIAYYLQQFKLLGYPAFDGLTILITCHAPSFICLDYNHVPVYKFPEYWTGQMEKATINSADILISPSRYFITEAQKRMPWNNIQEHIVVNPIFMDVAAPIPVHEPNYIVCFGKLSPLKGTFKLLEYFHQLWNKGFTHPLHIVGGVDQLFHPEAATMGELVNKQYVRYIKEGLLVLHNQLSTADAKALMQKAHIVLVPSLFDNLPYTVLEAMSWGKVVLASKQGGQSEVIQHGVNGFLFDHYKQKDLEHQLLQILELGEDAIQTIGNNAQRTIATLFAPQQVYEQKATVIAQYILEKKRLRQFPLVSYTTQPLPKVNSVQTELLSIVIPYYNMGAYIEESVQSVMQSDYAAKEIIIIDDGSTDTESIAQLAALQSKYPVQVHHKQNEGLPLTRNFGAMIAKGRYLAFLDADDTVEKDYYTKAIRVLNQYHNIHFVGCWVQYFEQGKDIWPTFNPEPPYLLLHNMVNSSALVFERRSFIKAGLNEPSLVYGMEDWDSIIGLVENGCYGVVLPEVLFHYRVRSNSMARKFTRVKRLYLNKVIAEKHPALYQQYGVEVALLLNNNGSGLDFDNPTFEASSNGWLPVKGALQERLKEKVKQNKFVRKIAYKVYKKIIK